MSDEALIFGKSTWPFTTAAREAFAKAGKKAKYLDVIKDPKELERMLEYTGGKRKVPVIVEGQEVTIGFEGKGWRV